MLIVGITGGIGSGKSAVTQQLESLGITVIDADIVAREVVEPGEAALQSISSHFGDTVINESGQLNRAELRALVFEKPEERKWLENLLHPLIRTRIVAQLNASNSSYTVLVSPLLLETDQHSLTDHIVVVDLPKELQIKRTMSRDNNNEKQVEAIINAQMQREEKLKHADSIIRNDEDLCTLREKVNNLHQKLLTLAHQDQHNE